MQSILKAMDPITQNNLLQNKTMQNKILIDVVKKLCAEPRDDLSSKVVEKVNRIIADCDLAHYLSLHTLDTSATLLGVTNPTSEDLTFEEQTELNEAIANRLQIYMLELKKIIPDQSQSKKQQIIDLQNGIVDRMSVLEKQELEKLKLMEQWVDHRVREVAAFSADEQELPSLNIQLLDLKSKILNQQILLKIFTETDKSVQAHTEMQKEFDIKIAKTKENIKRYQQIIDEKSKHFLKR